MNSIIAHLRSRKRRIRKRLTHNSQEIETTDERNQIIGGIGTIDGRIWIAYHDKHVVNKSIIKKDGDVSIVAPINAITNLDRGPTGNHDILISGSGVVELLYCHQLMATLTNGANVTLCGRTFIIEGDIEQDEDDIEERELDRDQHLRLSCGTIKVRVSAAGHRIYISKEHSDVVYSQFKINEQN